MEKVQSSPESAVLVAGLVSQLALERDPLQLVRRAVDVLRRDLAADWSCAWGTGDSSLGGLRLVQGCSDPEARLAALALPAEPAVERLRAAGALVALLALLKKLMEEDG